MAGSIKSWGKVLILYGAFIGGVLLGTKACDMAFNNQTVLKPGYFMKSKATGIMGHEEYVQYTDGSREVKLYPNIIGHRYGSSEFYQDLNGDGKVERIRINGPEWKMHKLETILIRENDYETNKEKFDKADQKLQELMKQYSK